jgi:hypothetical protein
VLIDHLRLDLTLGVLRKQGVVDHVAVVAHDVRRRPDGIDDLQVRVRNNAQRLLRLGRVRRGQQQGDAGEKG